MSFCKNFQMLLTTQDQQFRYFARARCGMWTCAHCAEINRKQWQARLIDHINNTMHPQVPYRKYDWSWITLTAHSKMRGAKKSIANLRGAWDVFMKRLRRKYPQGFYYVRVFEKHKDGSYHIHAILSLHFDDIRVRKHKDGKETKYSKWVQDTARELHLGRYTHADNIDASHHGGYVASYITKYLTKITPMMDEALGRVRNIQTSQDWPHLPKDNAHQWEAVTGYYDIEFYSDAKYKIQPIDISTGHEINSDDFLTTFVYPPEFGKVVTVKGKYGK